MNELMYSLKIYAYTIEYIIYYKTCTSRMHGHLLSFGVAIWGGGGGGGGGGVAGSDRCQNYWMHGNSSPKLLHVHVWQ